MSKKLRLARTLEKIGVTAPSPFVAYLGSQGTIPANEITGAVMHRGKSDRGGGVHPSTIELGTTRLPTYDASGYLVTFGLHTDAAAQISAYLAPDATVDPAIIAPRYHGRIGRIEVEDMGKRQLTSYSGASWINALNYAQQPQPVAGGQTLFSVIDDLCLQDTNPWGITLNYLGGSDSIAITQEPAVFKNDIGKYTDDVGILVRARRDGVYDVMSIDYRKSIVQSFIDTRPPLTRSQAISPAVWSQPNEGAGVKITFTAVDAATDAPFTRTIDTETGEIRHREVETIDWSYVKTEYDGRLTSEARARVYARSPRHFNVPSVKVDLLYLLSSDSAYHRRQAAALLMLEAGDPVLFSGDWPTTIRGVQFAEGITEHVTPDSWEIELKLVPYAYVTGDPANPDIPAQVWDSARYPWNDETRTWNEA